MFYYFNTQILEAIRFTLEMTAKTVKMTDYFV